MARTGNEDLAFVPPIEVEYKDNKLVVSAELPGVSNEDVSVAITDDAVTISGERRVEREENERGTRRTERIYGQFYRVIPLPDGADPDQATAELQNGILRITVPVAESGSGTRQIPVQASGTSQRAGEQSKQQSRSETQSGQKVA